MKNFKKNSSVGFSRLKFVCEREYLYLTILIMTIFNFWEMENSKYDIFVLTDIVSIEFINFTLS